MARQKLGQHFLVSEKVLNRIADAAISGGASLFVEIGPGRGALTSHLLLRDVQVRGIELDRELAEHLRVQFGGDPRFELVEGNALHVNWSQWGPGVLAGNLPYYVASAIISRYVRNPGVLSKAVFLIQREVAERITAKPGTRDYGYFSVECQFLAEADYLFTVPPGAFRPPPLVESAVIRLRPKLIGDPRAELADTDSFLAFASACFRQKRKTLRNNLSSLFPKELLDAASGMQHRAEQISVAELYALFRQLATAAA